MSLLQDLPTPALVLDKSKMDRNILKMQAVSKRLNVPLRPHGKTPKNVEIGRELVANGAVGLTVSTLREAEAYFSGGVTDLFYAVALAPAKVERVAALIKAGATITCLVDHPNAAAKIAREARRLGVTIPLAIEIDVDGYRAGLPDLNGAIETLTQQIVQEEGTSFAGIMSYGGASYNCTPPEAHDLAEKHRQKLIDVRNRVNALGIDCPMVSFGSSPATLYAETMEHITELRCGIYVFQDLFQAAIGACTIDDIAISVLVSVIGLRPDRNMIIVDAGGLAMSKDLSTARTNHDAGYGLVCDINGRLIGDLHIATTSQELGLITSLSGAPLPFDDIEIGTRLRILPNHADMTAAAYDGYHVVNGGNQIVNYWERANGW